MKLNRSQQLILGCLVIVVVAAVASLWPKSAKRPGPAQADSASAATNKVAASSKKTAAGDKTAAGTNKVATATSTNLVTFLPLVPIDRRYVQERWKMWLADATRDPFQIYLPAETGRDGEVSPARHLKLSATWLQTGSRLAVIDKRIYGVGEEVGAFKILRIEPGEVYLQGPEKTEAINFTSYVPPPPPGQRRSLTNVIDKLLGPERESLRN
jgi:hypothetical protein